MSRTSYSRLAMVKSLPKKLIRTKAQDQLVDDYKLTILRLLERMNSGNYVDLSSPEINGYGFTENDIRFLTEIYICFWYEFFVKESYDIGAFKKALFNTIELKTCGSVLGRYFNRIPREYRDCISVLGEPIPYKMVTKEIRYLNTKYNGYQGEFKRAKYKMRQLLCPFINCPPETLDKLV